MRCTKFIQLLLPALMGLFFITSCSNDDKYPEGVYVDISGKYLVSNTESGYVSIELTSYGMFIIELNEKSSSVTTRGDGVDIITGNVCIYGTYSQISSDIYKLDNFGNLTCTYTNNVITEIALTKIEKGVSNLMVTKATEYANSDKTEKLCRIWDFSFIEKASYHNDELIFNVEYNVGDTSCKVFYDRDNTTTEAQWIADSSLQLWFTRAGTCANIRKDGTTWFSTWQWKDESRDEITFDSYNETDNADVDYTYNLTFSHESLNILCDYTQTVDGIKYRWYTNLDLNETTK